MAVAGPIAPRLVRAAPGRLRVHLGGWGGEEPSALTARLAALPGVVSATASAATGNALLRFDPAATDAGELLAAIGALPAADPGADAGTRPSPLAAPEAPAASALPAASVTAAPGHRQRRARIAVRGLDRDPRVGRRVVERLRRRPGIRLVQASATTGRVLVEFSEEVVGLQDLLADVADVELPEEPGEDRPAHPLDVAPLVQSSARLIGAGAGLAVIAARRLVLGRREPTAPAAVAAALVGAAEGLPPVRRALREALGHDRAQLVLGAASVLTLTISGAPLGLAMTGAGALRLSTEVRARRAAWRDYEDRLRGAAGAHAGDTVRVEAGDRVALRATVVEGTGTAIGRDGLPQPIAPGATLEAGSRVFGGPLVAELLGGGPFAPPQRPAPPRMTTVRRYVEALGLASVAYAGVVLAVTRSPSRALTALLLVNPRPAIVGAEASDAGASARVLRAGVTVVATRPDRVVRRPDTIVLDNPRTIADGFELSALIPHGAGDPEELAELVAAVATAAASPWGSAIRARGERRASGGGFDGRRAHADVGGRRYRLEPAGARDATARTLLERGEHVLALRGPRGATLAVVGLRPRLAPGLAELVARARARGSELVLVAHRDQRAARAVARRAGIPLLVESDALSVVRERQRTGARVAVVADGAHAGEAFAAADLAIGLTSGRSGRFPARADLLAPDLSAVAAIVEAGALRDRAVAASVAASVAANVGGVAWGMRGAPGVRRASLGTYLAALGAIGAGWAILRGGSRSRSVAARLVDPRPERWGRMSRAEVAQVLRSAPAGLTEAAARERRRPPRRRPPSAGPLVRAMAAQLTSPLAAVLAAGAGLSLAMGAVADVPIIAAVVVANAAIGAWQERQSRRAADALERMGAPAARVLRDGRERLVPAGEVVAGDVLVLAPGDRVVADARLLHARHLEVDEAALTGESLPVAKRADAGPESSRVLLDGSDVTVGRGRAMAFAVGAGTRLGAVAAALEIDERDESPLSRRLGRLLGQSLPVVVGGGAIVAASGLLRRRPAMEQLALGASAAVAAVPEGLPLLAGVAEAAVARRLAGRHALVRRLAAVEGLGRVDVACFDKTGTLTQGRLAVTRVADLDEERPFPGELSAALRDVLGVAAVASPHPGTPGAHAHPTDVAVLRAAEAARLDGHAELRREREAPFDPSRAFHAAVAGGRLCVKGAAEALVERCTGVRRDGAAVELDAAGRAELLAAAERLASRGLRVLLVAEGRHGGAVRDPRDLVALGFVAISDPLRHGTAAAVRRCHAAGVRLVMLTGDHPATALAVAREAGLRGEGRRLMTGDEFAVLDDAELDRRLEEAEVIARITPLEKLRIVESLQRRGHTVAMTGDGVNDAPALRLADVGIAMGRGGTDVARQAADVVLADDDLATLVEALVEGRGFWRNMRHALALLLGGNLGELGLIAGAGALTGASLLTTRQILAINLVTDVLPAVAVAVQAPEHRELAGMAREGRAALDAPLRDDILRRGAATAAPSLAAALLAGRAGAHAPTIGFASVVTTQLAQTLDVGRVEGRLTRPVVAAVAAAGGLLAASIVLPWLRAFLGLALPGPAGLALVAAASGTSVALARALPGAGGRLSP